MPIFAKSYMQGLSDEKLLEIISKPVSIGWDIGKPDSDNSVAVALQDGKLIGYQEINKRIKFDAEQIVADMVTAVDHAWLNRSAPNKLYGAYINEYGEAV